MATATAASLHPRAAFRAFGEETVLVNLDTGEYFGLNETAGLMLELLADLGDLGAVAARVAERGGVPVERVQGDLEDLCAALAERDLLEVQRWR